MGRELSQPSACRSKRHGAQGGRDEEAGAARRTRSRTRGCRVQFRKLRQRRVRRDRRRRRRRGRIRRGEPRRRRFEGERPCGLFLGRAAGRAAGREDRDPRLGIAHGSFEDKVCEAHAVADSYAGFVVESFASQGSGKRIAEGSLVLRIPAESYDSALSRLRELGKVESLEESGQDVSKEFVDLNARIRQLRAVEAQLLELLQRADDVPAALAVQNQLSQVQLDLEQARGRLQYLDDQVSYATISVAMHESGAVAPKG